MDSSKNDVILRVYVFMFAINDHKFDWIGQ